MARTHQYKLVRGIHRFCWLKLGNLDPFHTMYGGMLWWRSWSYPRKTVCIIVRQLHTQVNFDFFNHVYPALTSYLTTSDYLHHFYKKYFHVLMVFMYHEPEDRIVTNLFHIAFLSWKHKVFAPSTKIELHPFHDGFWLLVTILDTCTWENALPIFSRLPLTS